MPCPVTSSTCRFCLRTGQHCKPDRKLKGPFAGLPVLLPLSLPMVVLPDWQMTNRASDALHRAVALCSATACMLTKPPRAWANATLTTPGVEPPWCMRSDRQSSPFWSSLMPTVGCPLALPFAASAVLATMAGRRTMVAAWTEASESCSALWINPELPCLLFRSELTKLWRPRTGAAACRSKALILACNCASLEVVECAERCVGDVVEGLSQGMQSSASKCWLVTSVLANMLAATAGVWGVSAVRGVMA